MYAQCSADNSNRYDNRYKGIVYIEGEGWKTVYAKPLKLKEDYFGKAGTITVGLARRNENPWFSVFGRVTGGIYSAFSPAQNSWTYCFASAKAGYKLYHETNDWYIDAHLGSKERTWHLDDWEEELNGNVRAWDGPRDYCIDWKPEQSKFAGWYWDKNERGDDVLVTEWTMPDELWPTWRQSWNLVQDDWDAVMVPVRQAGAEAIETQNYSLGEWWQKRLSGQYGKVSDISDRYEPAWQGQDSGYLASLVNDADWQVLSGSGVPNTGVTAGTTTGGTSQWNIGTPGGSLDWNQIGDEMYH